MRFIAIVPLWLGLISSCLAAPSQIISFQDSMGGYNFNYNEPLSSRSESRSADGMTHGIYSYVDADGNLQTSEYEAGSELGFNVKATNLPQAPLPVQDTPEIMAARQKHLQLLEEADRLEASEKASQAIDQNLLKTAATGEIQKSNEIPQALPKFQEQARSKEEPPKELESNRGDANLNPFLKGDFLSLPKISADALPLPKGDASFSPFNPFLKAHTNLLSLPKDQPNLPKIDASINTPEQRIAAPLPEQVKDTAEVAAARAAHLRTVAEAVAKSAIPVKDTPEVMAAREAHLRIAVQPGALVMPIESPMYTPEVQAAREAHFRAYQLAAKLAAESDVNPRIIEQLLGRPGEPKLGPQRIESLGSALMMDRSAVELPNPAMKVELPMTRTEATKESSTLPPDNRGIANLAEKPQVKEASKPPQTNFRIDTGITPASTSLRIADSKITLLDELEQAKMKADLICGTALKVKDVNDIKPAEDQRLIIVKSGVPAPFVSTVPLPIDQSERWKNWGFQYMSL